MNIFEKFSLSREVVLKEGEMRMDEQRMSLLPVNFVGLYSLSLRKNKDLEIKFYERMKSGMLNFSMPLGKTFQLSHSDFMDRWIKYAIFGGWGIVEYKLIDNEKNYGYLSIKELPLHMYLKSKGLKSASDMIFEGLMAGSLSTTFKADIYMIEVKCICSGDEACVYYWGSKEVLREKFPEIMKERFGEQK